MRVGLVIFIFIFATAAQAQGVLPGTFLNGTNRSFFDNNVTAFSSNPLKKWSITKYSAISTGYQFFKGGSASYFSAPMGLQLNRRLNDNLYGFAGISAAPTYANINSAFLSADASKAAPNALYMQSGHFGMYSKAELGLTYTNSDRTFSISGSIGVEKSSYPVYYNGINNTHTNPVFLPNK